MTLQRIDNLCDEFEAALRRGETLQIEDFLPKVSESEQSVLIKELLEIEIQFTLEHQPSDDSLRIMQESLLRRFPEQLDFIKSLFRCLKQLQQIGDYEILGELGRGGMGVVYKAKHKLLQQTVAVKVLSQALLDDSQAVGRFRREMQLIGGLTHPNVVRALNAGEAEGTHYLVMEFVDGITLQKLVECVRAKTGGVGHETTGGVSHPLVPLGAACEAIRQAALGLQNAHELKLVHRDIKPANLMLDHRGTVKILDLGLGKFAEERRSDYHSSLTVPGMVIGTVDYISPEQCENSGEADIRSDLYSLGCSLYFLLTGKPVYSGSRYDTMRKKLMAHIVGEVPSLKQTIPDLPPAIESILQKVLAKDPAERFQTPLEFAEALAPFASPDELWTLMKNVIPAESLGHSSSSLYSSSPYFLTQPSKPIGVNPRSTSRIKWIAFLAGVNILIFGLGIGAALYFYAPIISGTQQTEQMNTMMEDVKHSEENALALRKQWKMAEALTEYQKAAQVLAKMVLQTENSDIRKNLTQNQIELAKTYWYFGDSSRARSEMQSIQNRIEDRMKQSEELASALNPYRKVPLTSLADFVLFGGAASGTITEERLKTGMRRYNEAAEDGSVNPRNRVIRWKQAILSSLLDDLNEAERLLMENPVLSKEPDMYFSMVHQLAEAVIFYKRAGNEQDGKDRKLRAFQGQFGFQSNALQESINQPEILELLLFCGELLLNDSIKRADWKTLGDDFAGYNNASANFLRQNPGATPFLRRFLELLVRSAVLLYENAEQPKDKQKYLGSIARLLERMRLPFNEAAEVERPTLIFFFLPASNKPEEGFVLFYPQDGTRLGALYPLPLTRQMVNLGQHVPPLDTKLLEQVTAERNRRISWNDRAAWSRTEDALTDKDYPYGDVLPLR